MVYNERIVWMTKDKNEGRRSVSMVTIKEIAKKSNVSVATVSNILNGKPKAGEETRQRVLKVIEEMGYQPNYIAQGLRKQKTQLIGVIVEDIIQFSSPGMIEGLMAYCEEQGYNVIVLNLRFYTRWKGQWQGREEEFQPLFDAALQELLSMKADGIVYIACHAREINCFPSDLRIPAVIAYAYSKCVRFPSIVINDEKGGYDVTNYLISMGHRKIGVVGGEKDNIHTQKRLLGYQRALFEKQLLYNPEWIRYGEWNREAGYKQVKELVSQGVSAIFGMADTITAGIYDFLEESNLKVGEDISVVGYDDMASEFFRPALTSMRLPLSEIGKSSAEMIIKLIENGEGRWSKGIELEMDCDMVIRKSVKKLNNVYE